MSSVGLQPVVQAQSPPTGRFSSSGNRPYLYALLLAILCVALYFPVRSHPFVNYDDNVYVSENTQVRSGLTWDTVTWAFTSYDAGNWHPVTWLSHSLDVELFGLNPSGHHQTSVLLHALNTLLLFWVLAKGTGYVGRSLMVSALFAVHPINVESVVWISERKNLLSMMFFLLALGAYRWYAANPKLGRYCTVAVLFALGLMSKPQVITLPFVLLLWDYWPLQRMILPSSKAASNVNASPSLYPPKSLRALIEEKLPLFGIAAASAVMTMKAQSASGAVLSMSATPLSVRLANAIVSYARYLQKAVWPVHLAPMYPHPGSSLPAWQVYGALLLLLVVTFLVESRRRRYLLVGWLWFLGTLVPMIGLVQVGRQAMADRYAYLPLIGIFLMVCWAVADWAEQTRLPSTLLPVAGLIIIAALSVVTRRQIGYWADNVTLWTHTIEVTAPNYVAQDDLGGSLMERNRMDEAIVHFRQAAAIHPVDPVSALNIGFYEQQHGNLSVAIDWYKKAVVLTTSPAVKIKALNNMGIAYRTLGNSEQARECFDAAKKLRGL